VNDFKPMLSATLLAPETLQFPLIVSPKLDGLRCVIRGGIALSRNLKPFRNEHVQRVLKGLPDGLDGELIVGPPNTGHVLNRTQSGIMSTHGEPDFTYWVFDNYACEHGFVNRLRSLGRIEESIREKFEVVDHTRVETLEGFFELEEEFLKDGYEGIMLRDIQGEYKHGRSTLNEGGLMKYKRFQDGEALVLEVAEGVHNENELTYDALGRAKRSHHQANKIGSKRVGTIIGKNILTGETMQISPGRMTQDQRIHYWEHKNEILGKMVKFKSFEYGKLNNSRFVTFQAFRDEADLG